MENQKKCELTEESTVRKFRTVQIEGAGSVSHKQALEKAYMETIKNLEKEAKPRGKK